MAAAKALIALSLMGLLVPAALHAADTRQETIRTPLMTPTQCEVLERFEAPNRVHLRTADPCPQHSGVIEVYVPRGVAQLEVFLQGRLLGTQRTQSLGVADINRVFAQNHELEKKLEGQELIGHNEQAIKRARDLSDLVNSSSYQARLAAERSRIEEQLFSEQVKLLSQERLEEMARQLKAGPLAQDERIYLFVSSSMPKKTLSTYIQAVDKVGDANVTLVLRGLVGGAQQILPTIEFFNSVLAKDPDCNPLDDPARGCESYQVGLVVDPLLYQRYEVSQVPTLVYARGVKRTAGEEDGSEGLCENVAIGQSWSVSGDVSIEYMLERINSEAQSETLSAYVAALRKGFF